MLSLMAIAIGLFYWIYLVGSGKKYSPHNNNKVVSQKIQINRIPNTQPLVKTKLKEKVITKNTIDDVTTTVEHYSDLDVTDETIDFFNDNETREDILKFATSTEFTTDELIEEEVNPLSECSNFGMDTGCELITSRYKNRDGSTTKIISVDGIPFLKRIQFPDQSQVTITTDFQSQTTENVLVHSEEEVHHLTLSKKGIIIDHFSKMGDLFIELSFDENGKINDGNVAKKIEEEGKDKLLKAPFPIQ